MRYTVVDVADTSKVHDKTNSKREAVALCRWHPERGVLHRNPETQDVRFLRLPNTPDFASERKPRRR